MSYFNDKDDKEPIVYNDFDKQKQKKNKQGRPKLNQEHSLPVFKNEEKELEIIKPIIETPKEPTEPIVRILYGGFLRWNKNGKPMEIAYSGVKERETTYKGKTGKFTFLGFLVKP